MFYSMYLLGLCERRRWPEPLYEPYVTRLGYCCKVRVNNREYVTDVTYKTEAQALENAAQQAFMICRNFSANDGMYPGQRPGQTMASGTVQGLPVAIGSGRRNKRNSDSSVDSQYYEGSSSGGNSPKGYSGGNSPQGYSGGFDQPVRQTVPAMPRPMHKSRADSNAYMCMCKRGPVSQYALCTTCAAQRGWTAPSRMNTR
ncbi:hypothetical protein AMS68_004972 [Peltaster fructicola]|uniref:DRBM domain-containing protein n=1 Tax=Peltaster fructicola TaxID=286661 RepID=A0A6H0XXS1_9PEZI|nr:hypothetical protein AMS68_004972 [Peltaster fructicola]